MKKGMKLPEGWKKVELRECFSRLVRKNDEGNTNVLTISAQHGLISQEKFFNKSIASEDKSNYFLLEKGDFAYNKSYSASYPFGAIKSLEKYEKGIVSPLYICFKKTADNKCPEYFLHYFEAGLANNEICAIAQEGARNHGLLNISTDDFFKIKILLPPLPEQQKIAEVLSTQDKVIELKEKLLEQKQTQKKWLMQKLLSNDGATFTLGGVRIDKSGWAEKCLGDIAKIKGGKRIPKGFSLTNVNTGHPYLTVSNMKKGTIEGDILFVPENIVEEIKSYRVDAGDIYITVAGTLGIIGIIPEKYDKANLTENADKIVDVKCNKLFLYHLLTSSVIQDQVASSQTNSAQPKLAIQQIQGFVFLLPSLPEQQAIAEVLSTADKEIDLLKSEIEQEKLKKKSLMQLLLTGIVRVKV